jgi:hypothetical protein
MAEESTRMGTTGQELTTAETGLERRREGRDRSKKTVTEGKSGDWERRNGESLK